MKMTKASLTYKNWFLTLLLLVCMLFTAFAPQAVQAAASQKIVRVGWYRSDDFQEGMSDNEVKRGYAFDYLQNVANYTNWRFEYVYGEWPVLYQMLENGEIDLMGGVSPTEERKQTLLFPDSAMGVDQYYMYKHANDSSISSKNIQTLNGKKIGGIKNNRLTVFAEQWIKENHVNLQMVYFDGFEAQEKAFQKGEVDLLTQTINNVLSMKDITIVAKVGEEPFCMAVSKKRPDLLGELNASLTTMLSLDPFILQNLQYANYGSTLTTKTLTEEEKLWFNKHSLLKIGYWDKYMPYCTTGEDGSATGLLVDVVKAMREALGQQDKTKLSYKAYPSYYAMIKALKNGEVDVIFPVYGNLWQLEQDDIAGSNVVIASGESLFFKGSYDKEKFKKIAVNENSKTQLVYTQNIFPQAEIVKCPSIEACLDAVMSGKADAVIINSLRNSLVTSNAKYKSLNYTSLPYSQKKCFGVRSNDTTLLLLLNRGLRLIGPNYGFDSANKYTAQTYTMTTVDFLRQNAWWISFIVIAIGGIIMGLLVLNIVRQRKHMLKQREFNKELRAQQLSLQEISMDQQAQLAKVKNLNRQLKEKSAAQKAQIEQISKLNASLAEYNDIIANAGYGVWHIILKEGSAPRMQVNAKMAELLGIDASTMTEEEIYYSWYSNITAEAIPSVQASVQEMMDGSFSENTYKWKHPTKGIIYVRCGGTAVQFNDGTSVCSGYHADVTDIVLEEEKKKTALAQAQAQAEAASKAKSTFLFNMSHDIRTPMNAIMGFTELLKKHKTEPERVDNYLAKIETSSQFLLSLINNVLEMARIESGNTELQEIVCQVEELNRSIIAVFEEQMWKKHLHFLVNLNIEHKYVYVDPVKLREIFLNLISNAYKYTPEGGVVSVEVKELPADKAGCVAFQTTITDTGIGMSKEFLPHLFEEFSREKNVTENRIEGTGLGMPIVKKLVELMGGTITVSSELGKGTTFVVTIAHRLAEAKAVTAAEAKTVDPQQFVGKRILLAEDNALNAEIATELLQEAGFLVEVAGDGAICVEMLKQAEAGYYDLILMDIQMPKMNGYEATETIRALDDRAKAEIPILAMTANAFEEDRQNAFKAGMDGHLAKPIDIQAMVQMLAKLLK